MKEQFELLKKKYSALLKSNYVAFIQIAAMKKITGVYMIYSPDEELIYIGNTNNFRVRFGTDLKHESTHTLMNKFLKQEVFPDRKLAKEYLTTKCKIKIEVCDNKREAEALETFAIWVLNPKYNK